MTESVFVPAAPALAAAAIAAGLPRSEAAIARVAIGALAIGLAAAVASAPAAPLAGFVASTVAVLALIVGAFAARALQGGAIAYRRFFALLTAAVGGSLTVAVAVDLRVLAAAWIATGLCTSALLDGDGRPAARRWARRHLLVERIGDAALLLALASAWTANRGFDLAALAHAGVPGVLPVALVVAGAARSALVPLHAWLPNSMEAPTPVSAIMHAGLVNGAGVLLAKCAAIMIASPLALGLAALLGATTAAVATFYALPRAEAKRRLGWSTAAQMGFMVLQCGCGAFAAAIVHLAAHGAYKCAAFLGVADTIETYGPRLRRSPGRLGRGPVALLALLGPTLVLTAAVLLPGSPITSLAAAPLVLAAVWSSAAAATRLGLRAAGTPASIALAVALPVAVALGYLGAVVEVESWISVPAVPPAIAAFAPVAAAVIVAGALVETLAPPLSLSDRLYTCALVEGRAPGVPASS